MADAVTSDPRETMAALYRASEPDVLKPLLDRAALTPDSRAPGDGHRPRAARRSARGAGARVGQPVPPGVSAELVSEGVALLSLAEAFLRVPDPETADLLIADKLGDADWRAHAGKSNSALVNSATWGLVIGRALVGEGGGARCSG